MTLTSTRIATAQEADAQRLRAVDGALTAALVVLQRDPSGARTAPEGDDRCAAPLGDGPAGALRVDDGLGETVAVTSSCRKGGDVGTTEVLLRASASGDRVEDRTLGTATLAVRTDGSRRTVTVLDWNLRPDEPEVPPSTAAPPTTVPTTTTTVPPAGAVTWQLAVTSDWTAGYCAEVKVANRGREPVRWSVTVPVEGAPYTVWSGVWTQEGAELRVRGEHWNHTLQPGSATSFGFCANR
jgi:cellulase/cellobiase CelA1